MNRLRVGAPRAAIFLGLGGVLAASAALPACRSSDDTTSAEAPATPERGVVTKVSEVAPGRFVIDDESVVDGPTRVQVQRLDGTRTMVDSPESFAALLAPLDTLRAYDAATGAQTPTPDASGGGGSWDDGKAPSVGDAPRSADGTSWAVPAAAIGLPLGVVLAQTMAMPLWHPPAYASVARRGSDALAYRTPAVRDSTRRRGGMIAGMILLGRMPYGARQAVSMRGARASARATPRASSPSRGRGGFGRSWGGSGG